jgi:hypothetical protein
MGRLSVPATLPRFAPAQSKGSASDETRAHDRARQFGRRPDRQRIAWCIREAASASMLAETLALRTQDADDDRSLLVAIRVETGERIKVRADVADANINVSTLNRRIKHCIDDAKRLFAGARPAARLALSLSSFVTHNSPECAFCLLAPNVRPCSQLRAHEVDAQCSRPTSSASATASARLLLR